MCGLIGIINTKGGELHKDFLLDQYDEQKGRGSQGFGLLRAENKTPIKVRRATEATKAMIEIIRAEESCLFFHHRFPTSTPNEQDQTHPMVISNKELKRIYYIMHNGVIGNATELKRIHEDLGYIYQTKTTSSKYYPYTTAIEKFNDSESFAIEIARFIEGKDSLIKTTGSAAFLVMAANKETRVLEELLWGTNGRNPLIRETTPNGIILASALITGEDVVPGVLESIKTTDLYSNKEKDLTKYIKQAELNFQKEPEKSPIQISIPGKTYTEPPTSTAYKTTEEPKEYLPKDPPQGYTELEWAIQKIGLRAMNKIRQVVIAFTEDLSLGERVQISLPDGGWLDKESDDTPEDKIEYALYGIEEILTEIAKKAENVREIYEKKELLESGGWIEHPMESVPDATNTEDNERSYPPQTEEITANNNKTKEYLT